jgi:hypothetical protein
MQVSVCTPGDIDLANLSIITISPSSSDLTYIDVVLELQSFGHVYFEHLDMSNDGVACPELSGRYHIAYTGQPRLIHTHTGIRIRAIVE